MIDESGASFDGRIQNLIDGIASNRRGQIGVGEQPVDRQRAAPTVLNFREAVRLLMADYSSHDLDENSTVVLEDVTEKNFGDWSNWPILRWRKGE